MINIFPSAVIDEKQKEVIYKVQEQTYKFGVTLTVTRGHSSALEQLKTVEDFAKESNCLFPEFLSGNLKDTRVVWRDGHAINAYLWQQSWAMLLLKYTLSNGKQGKVVNPPASAVCLEHYIRPNCEDMYMKVIHVSPHIEGRTDKATDFQKINYKLDSDKITFFPIDFSARVDREMKTERIDIPLVIKILTAAKADGAGIRFIKPEPANVCVHVDTE